MGQRGPAQVERPVEVHREIGGPVLVGHRRRVPHLVKTRDVGQDVEPAEVRDTVFDGLCAGLGEEMSTDVERASGTSANTSAIRAASRAMPNTFAPRSANNRAVAAPRPTTHR